MQVFASLTLGQVSLGDLRDAACAEVSLAFLRGQSVIEYACAPVRLALQAQKGGFCAPPPATLAVLAPPGIGKDHTVLVRVRVCAEGPGAGGPVGALRSAQLAFLTALLGPAATAPVLERGEPLAVAARGEAYSADCKLSLRLIPQTDLFGARLLAPGEEAQPPAAEGGGYLRAASYLSLSWFYLAHSPLLLPLSQRALYSELFLSVETPFYFQQYPLIPLEGVGPNIAYVVPELAALPLVAGQPDAVLRVRAQVRLPCSPPRDELLTLARKQISGLGAFSASAGGTPASTLQGASLRFPPQLAQAVAALDVLVSADLVARQKSGKEADSIRGLLAEALARGRLLLGLMEDAGFDDARGYPPCVAPERLCDPLLKADRKAEQKRAAAHDKLCKIVAAAVPAQGKKAGQLPPLATYSAALEAAQCEASVIVSVAPSPGLPLTPAARALVAKGRVLDAISAVSEDISKLRLDLPGSVFACVRAVTAVARPEGPGEPAALAELVAMRRTSPLIFKPVGLHNHKDVSLLVTLRIQETGAAGAAGAAQGAGEARPASPEPAGGASALDTSGAVLPVQQVAPTRSPLRLPAGGAGPWVFAPLTCDDPGPGAAPPAGLAISALQSQGQIGPSLHKLAGVLTARDMRPMDMLPCLPVLSMPAEPLGELAEQPQLLQGLFDSLFSKAAVFDLYDGVARQHIGTATQPLSALARAAYKAASRRKDFILEVPVVFTEEGANFLLESTVGEPQSSVRSDGLIVIGSLAPEFSKVTPPAPASARKAKKPPTPPPAAREAGAAASAAAPAAPAAPASPAPEPIGRPPQSPQPAVIPPVPPPVPGLGTRPREADLGSRTLLNTSTCIVPGTDSDVSQERDLDLLKAIITQQRRDLDALQQKLAGVQRVDLGSPFFVGLDAPADPAAAQIVQDVMGDPGFPRELATKRPVVQYMASSYRRDKMAYALLQVSGRLADAQGQVRTAALDAEQARRLAREAEAARDGALRAPPLPPPPPPPAEPPIDTQKLVTLVEEQEGIIQALERQNDSLADRLREKIREAQELEARVRALEARPREPERPSPPQPPPQYPQPYPYPYPPYMPYAQQPPGAPIIISGAPPYQTAPAPPAPPAAPAPAPRTPEPEPRRRSRAYPPQPLSPLDSPPGPRGPEPPPPVDYQQKALQDALGLVDAEIARVEAEL